MQDHGRKGFYSCIRSQKKKIESLNQINLILAIRKEQHPYINQPYYLSNFKTNSIGLTLLPYYYSKLHYKLYLRKSRFAKEYIVFHEGANNKVIRLGMQFSTVAKVIRFDHQERCVQGERFPF